MRDRLVTSAACLIATAAVAGCGARPPQAPKRDAHELNSALSAVSNACGKAEERRAFGSLDGRDADLVREVLSAAGPLRAVYRRNPRWVFQDQTVEQLVKAAVSQLEQCGLGDAARALEARTPPKGG